MTPLSTPCSPSQHVDRSAPPRRSRAVRGAFSLLLALSALPAMAQVSLTTLDVAYTQNFDTLPNSGAGNAWTNNPPGPNALRGWHAIRDVAGVETAVSTIDAGAGASNSGQLYSFGTGTQTDRALGTVGSNGSGHFHFGVRLKNDTGAVITSLDVSYFGEQWRNGGNTTPHTATFSYVSSATPYTGSLADFVAAGTNVAALNFTGPIATNTAATVDGNVAGRSPAALSQTLAGLNIQPGDEIFLRWSDPNNTGNDHGLAIDDVSITPHGTVPLPTLTIADVSQVETNAGTTNFHFTVNLSAAAPVGGVTFDIATADGPDANDADAGSDYTAYTENNVVILEGATSYEFDVVVSGDTTLETDEDFLVDITGITGASNATAQATGTIENDDAGLTLSVADASVTEGNGGGTTAMNFTVQLDGPAPVGGVGFTVTTADIPASAEAGVDYTAQTNAPHTIDEGLTSYQFSVSVAADDTFETDETFNVTVGNVTNAVGGGTVVGTINNDDPEPADLIHDVQGNGAATPIPGQTVTIEGVVIGDYQTQGTGQLRGFFVQEEDDDVDADPATSEGIFVFCSACPDAVAEGQLVRVTGTVSEFPALPAVGSTQISATTVGSVVVLDAGNHLADVTPFTIDLPIVGDVNAFHEARESMLVTYSDTLKVSEYFQLARFGQITLFEGERPRQFTADNAPSAAGLTAHLAELATRRVILDDTDNGDNGVLNLPDGQEAIFHPQNNGGFGVGTHGVDFFRGGDEVTNLTGVLHWSFAGSNSPPTDAWRIRPTAAQPVTFTPASTRPATPPAVGGAIRAAGANVLNYFTTIDTTASNNSGTCGPDGTQDCRGADSAAELVRQRERTSIVLCGLNADVQGLIEIENHPDGDALTDLIAAVNARCGGAHPYALAGDAESIGTDAIRVALIYRTGVLAPVGALQVDMDPVHNRPPNAQTFDVVDATNPAFGERFTAIVNHFKSKGCGGASGGDADAGDGQSCYAETRTDQAERLVSWINTTVVPNAGDADVLLLGDFNSNAMEDPIIALADGGYTDLMTLVDPDEAYSYLFDGQLGHLDYALASDTLLGQVADMTPWHINADEVPVFDYNDEIDDLGEAAFEKKPDGSALVPPRNLFDAATPYRAADHDPVLVGLFPVVNANVGIAIEDAPDPVTAGTQLVYSITVDNAGPDAAEDVEWSGTLPADAQFVSLMADAGWACDTPAVGQTGAVSCSIASLPVGEDEFSLTVTIDESVAQDTVLDYTVAVVSGSVDGDSNNDDATASTTVNAAPEGLLLVTPDSVDFGDVTVGDTSSTVFVTVSNDGDATLSVSPDAAAAPFARAGGTCSANATFDLAAGADCTIGYTFSPTDEGASDQTIAFATTAPVSGTGSVALSGNGLPVPEGQLTIAPTALAFGGVDVGDTSAAQFVTLSNEGDAALDVTALTDASGAFARAGGTCAASAPFTLAVNASCTIGYTFSPTDAGAANQVLDVTANAPGSGTITLSGTGVAVPEADIAVTIDDGRNVVGVGQTLDYVIVVSNAAGPTTATVTVEDVLPAELADGLWDCIATGAGASCSGGTGNTLTDVATLPAGTFVTYVFSATVQPGTEGASIVNEVTTTVGGGVPDPDPLNNSASDTDVVVNPIFEDGFETIE